MDRLVSPGTLCYAEKQEKPFWFSSLGQIIQFSTRNYFRTSKIHFGQFVRIEKKSHYNSRVSLHEALTKNQNDIANKISAFTHTEVLFTSVCVIQDRSFKLTRI